MTKVKVTAVYVAFEGSKEAGPIGSFEVDMEVKHGVGPAELEEVWSRMQNLTEAGWLNTEVDAGRFTPVEDKVKVINGHRSMRSCSTHDGFILEFSENDTGYFLVDFAGFKEVSEFQFNQHVKTLTEFRDDR